MAASDDGTTIEGHAWVAPRVADRDCGTGEWAYTEGQGGNR